MKRITDDEYPLVSIVMASYNHERFIEKSIDSILNQTYRNIELIIVDDNSTDNSFLIIKKKAESDRRIRIIKNDKNMGISETMNRGIDLATGEYIMFASSDDTQEPNLVYELVNTIKHSISKNVVVWADGTVIDSNDNLLCSSFLTFLRLDGRKKEGNLFKELLKGNFIFGQTTIRPTELMKRIKFDPSFKYLNDYVVELYSSIECTYIFIPKKLANYRIHGKNSILRDKEGWRVDMFKANMLIISKFWWKLGFLDILVICSKTIMLAMMISDTHSIIHNLMEIFVTVLRVVKSDAGKK